MPSSKTSSTQVKKYLNTKCQNKKYLNTKCLNKKYLNTKCLNKKYLTESVFKMHYPALPMYHTAGAAVCFGNVLTEGLSLVARRQVLSQ